jgi:very-short-patch-repair endonuclease
MLTGLFRDKARLRAGRAHLPDDVLALLLHSKSLLPHRFQRRCEIGPFVVAHVCAQRALIVELSASGDTAERRVSLLESLGYRIVKISHRDLRNRPDVVLAQVREALK